MAVVTQAAKQLTLNSAYAALTSYAFAGVQDVSLATSTTDGIELTGARPGDRAIVVIATDATGADVVMKAGAVPQAHRGGLGDLTITNTANNVKLVPVEFGRFAKAGTKITAVPASTTAAKVGMYILPKGG